MKHFFNYVFTCVLLMASIACSASQEEEKDIVLVNEGEKYGLGVVIGELEQKDQERLGIDKGARVLDIVEDSEAERIGLRKDDVIVEFDGRKIESAEALHDLVAEVEEEKEVQLAVIREGEQKSFTANLKKLEPKKVSVHIDGSDFEFGDFSGLDKALDIDIKMPKFWYEQSKGGFLGVAAENISDQMLDYFEVEHGVLIEEVYEDTPAEKFGLKAGDVIVRVEDRDIKDYSDLIRTLNYYNPGEKVKIEYVRKGESKHVTVTLAEKDRGFHTIIIPEGNKHFKFKALVEDSLQGLKKEMKVLKKELNKVGEELKDIDIDLDFFII